MSRHGVYLLASLSVAIWTPATAGSDSQSLHITVPRLAALQVEAVTPLSDTAQGTSRISLTSNDPDTILKIIPAQNIGLSVTSNDLACRTESSDVICEVGLKRLQNSVLTLNATVSTADATPITYRLE